MIVTYRPEDQKYDVRIDGAWFVDIPKAPTEPREMPRIMRIRKDTREDRKALTTSFWMMVDGEEMRLIVSYSKKIWQLRSEMGKFKAIANGKKSLHKTSLFPFFFFNHHNDIKVAVMLEKDPLAFNVDLEGIAWDEIEYFAPTRSIIDDHIDPF